jgi:hypothetical protein
MMHASFLGGDGWTRLQGLVIYKLAAIAVSRLWKMRLGDEMEHANPAPGHAGANRQVMQQQVIWREEWKTLCRRQ